MSSTARKLLLFGQRQTFTAYMQSLGLALWYPLNEPSGSTAINYGSLASANATNSGATVGQTGIILPPPNAYSFDGINDSMSVAYQAAFNFTGNVSVMALVNLAAFTNTRLIGTPNWELEARLSGNSIRMRRIRATTNQFAVTSTAYSTSTWYMIHATATDDATPQIWINGAEVAYNQQVAGAGAYTTSTNDISIGVSGAVFYSGQIDELAVRNTAWTLTEIQTMAKLAGLA